MAKKQTKDMTTGSPMKLILSFLIPMLFGLLFQQLYNMVDTIIVGKYLGVNALAAVGSTGSINFMIIGFCVGVCSGFAIPVAQKFGEKNEVALRRFVANGGWLALMCAVPEYPYLDEYAGGHYRRGVLLHFYYIFGNTGYIPL